MTAQPLEADATPPPTPAQWLKTALAPRKRIMALASGLVIADAVPAVGFAAGLALAVGALPQTKGFESWPSPLFVLPRTPSP